MGDIHKQVFSALSLTSYPIQYSSCHHLAALTLSLSVCPAGNPRRAVPAPPTSVLSALLAAAGVPAEVIAKENGSSAGGAEDGKPRRTLYRAPSNPNLTGSSGSLPRIPSNSNLEVLDVRGAMGHPWHDVPGEYVTLLTCKTHTHTHTLGE